MCPITIIQAPITVNGDNSVNVHQSIVLASNKSKKMTVNKVPGSHKQSLQHKPVDLNIKNIKAPNEFDIFVKKSGKNSSCKTQNNPYAKKLTVKNKNSLRVSTQQSNYSNNEVSHLMPSSQYAVSSSFSKRKSTDLCRSQQNQNFCIQNKSKIRMKKSRKASDSAQRKL